MKCWIKKKDAEKDFSSGTNDELLTAQLEIFKLQSELSVLRLGPQSGIEPEMLTRLIRLCHPDRHKGSEGATSATQWLLAQRK